MTAQEVKKAFMTRYCNYCQSNDYYCPSPCGFLKFAEALSDKQWEDITRKYVDGDEIDFYAVARSVSNRKYYRKEVEQ